MIQPRRGWIMLADGRRMETARWGPEDEQQLVLLHEGLGCIALWRDVPARLAALTGCGVFAWSRLGYGQSDGVPLPRPLTYMQDEAREMLPLVLDQAGVTRAVLVGHSDGGSIAVIHAGTCQDPRIAGIALLAPHVFVEALCLDAIAAATRRWETTDLRDRLARHHRDPDGAFRGWSGAWLDPGFPPVLDLAASVAGIRVPILVIQGEADPYGTVAQVDRLRRDLAIPVEVLVLPGIGHAPHQEAPDQVLPTIAGFAARALAVNPAI